MLSRYLPSIFHRKVKSASRPYQLHFHTDYLQLPVEEITSLSRVTVASQTGPDVGFLDIDPSPKNTQQIVDNPSDWRKPNPDLVYGLSTSLYDCNPSTGDVNGEPIADCFAICTQENNAVLIIADGVNWGYKARLAARCAIHGAMTSLREQLFSSPLKSTKDIFQRMRMAIDAAQILILKKGGTFTTLTISIVCPSNDRWLVCTTSVGDSNAYVYSYREKTVYELTQGSRDLNDERDMRSPGGVLGTTIDEQPDLSNLTYSLMEIQSNDFVFLTTDGISDNYDPCVIGNVASINKPSFMRLSKTTTVSSPSKLMTAYERHLAALERMKSVIDADDQTLNAFDLAHRLLNYVIRLTDEQRQTIEQGMRENQGVEGAARHRFENEMLKKVETLPGKLDHASIVVYQIRS